MGVLKKNLLIAFFFFVVSSVWSIDWFAFGGSIGTAGVVNGDSGRKFADGVHRIVLETDVTAEFVIHPMIRVALGSVILADFNFKDDKHFNSLDYSFYAGIRVYPGLAGLRLGVDYNLGRRTDFIDIATFDETRSTHWGNGFRFLLEYDFKSGNEGLAPIVGGSWRHVPRGGSSDHIFSIFFKLLYR